MKRKLIYFLSLGVLLLLAAGLILARRPTDTTVYSPNNDSGNDSADTAKDNTVNITNQTGPVAALTSWQTFTDGAARCFTISYPSSYLLNNPPTGPLYLDRPASGTLSTGIMILNIALPSEINLDQFVLQENDALRRDTETNLSEEMQTFPFEATTLGAFRYKQKTILKTGAESIHYLAPALDGRGYYGVTVINQSLDETNVSAILSSFQPYVCTSSSLIFPSATSTRGL